MTVFPGIPWRRPRLARPSYRASDEQKAAHAALMEREAAAGRAFHERQRQAVLARRGQLQQGADRPHKRQS